MSDFPSDRFVERLRAALDRHVPPDGRRFAVAFSGGLDSTVLLAAMVRLAAGPDGGAPPLRALHVDHALHPDSAAWERHCRAVAAELGVRFDSVRVTVDRAAPAGLEAAAREARYAAFAGRLDDGEILLTAHHADDQLETLLLRLLRGTGVRGLRGILPFAPLGRGAVARPLLDFDRAEIRAEGERSKLDWLEDPSNRDVDLDRNYLRECVVPLLRRRWSAAARSGVRLAAAMADAEEILEAAACADLAGVIAPDRVPLEILRGLDRARRRNALRRALRESGLSMPTARQLEQLDAATEVGRPDAQTRVAWPGGEARVYRDTLYLLRPMPDAGAAGAGGTVSDAAPWSGPEGCVALAPVDGRGPDDAAVLPAEWAREGLEVRFRIGGERFRPAGDAHSRTLKAWFQQQGIVPWMRERIPLLYRAGRLVAVADLVVDDEAYRAAADAPRCRVEWSGHPGIH
ncbi:MAG: tRNA lysidine(34) synthetase TilS [Gammaproteobacteria bacterium]|nr:tRNA lysidine(34) synthetase TilS [Gammaproteobacteria bacterium]